MLKSVNVGRHDMKEIWWVISWGHTDWIASFGLFDGLCEWAKAKAVLSPDSEEVFLSIDQIGNHQGLSSTGWIHLEERAPTPTAGESAAPTVCCYIDIGTGSDLGPSFAINCLLLYKVALDSLSSVTQWGFPGESAGSPCYITDLQVSWRSRQV